MAVKAQIIEEKAQQKCAGGHRQAVDLKRCHHRENAQRDKRRKSVNWVTQQARCNAGQRVLCGHFPAGAPELDRREFNPEQQEEEQSRIEADVAMDEIRSGHKTILFNGFDQICKLPDHFIDTRYLDAAQRQQAAALPQALHAAAAAGIQPRIPPRRNNKSN